MDASIQVESSEATFAVSSFLITLPALPNSLELAGIAEQMYLTIDHMSMVVLSYEAGYKIDLVRRIQQSLSRRKVKTWMYTGKDVEMRVREVSAAMENAKVFLMCCSETYQNDASCRNEANYARDLRMQVIPVKLQDFDLKSWTGINFAGKNVVDFSQVTTSAEFDAKISELYDEIEDSITKFIPRETDSAKLRFR